MPSIFDVAKYILTKCGEMSTMKLQKLCYYCQAWANGPVCYQLFVETRGLFSVTADNEPGDTNNLDDSQKETINLVLDHYAKHDAQWLSRLTHMEQPWNTARKDVLPGQGCQNIITKESMAIYYGGL